jgi:hypothetical protein
MTERDDDGKSLERMLAKFVDRAQWTQYYKWHFLVLVFSAGAVVALIVDLDGRGIFFGLFGVVMTGLALLSKYLSKPDED